MEKHTSDQEIIDDITKLNIQTDTACGVTEDLMQNAGTRKNRGESGDFHEDTTEILDDEASSNKYPDFIEDIDDETLQNREISMSESDKEKYKQEALELKIEGNKKFGAEDYLNSINLYTEALNVCPINYKEDRSIFYCNRAAAKLKLDYTEIAIEDCTKAIELNPNYIKAYLRRAKLYEKSDKLEQSLSDFKKILELEPSNDEANVAVRRLPPLINLRNEALKTEMLGKLKDLGNLVLKPFGMSTDNFKLEQDPNTGGYSVNFQQNHKN